MTDLMWFIREIEVENERAERYHRKLSEALLALSQYLKRLNLPVRIRDPVPFYKDKAGNRDLKYYLVLDYSGLHYAVYDGEEERFYNFNEIPRERVVQLYRSGRIVEFLKYAAAEVKLLRLEQEKRLETAEKMLRIVKECEKGEKEGE